MSDQEFELLPEGYPVDSVVDDPVFTEVTSSGEMYTLYRIVRVTHIARDHPDGWTHRANVVRIHEPQLGVALLKVVNRVIRDARVALSPTGQ